MHQRTAFLAFLMASAVLGAPPALGSVKEAQDLEREGDPLGARQVLDRLAESASADREALLARAEFLDRYGDSRAVPAYFAALDAIGDDDPSAAAELRRKITLAALIHGDDDTARSALESMRASGDSGWAGAASILDPPGPAVAESIAVPGTLTSFRRMAALSTGLTLEEILPSLGRTIFTGGYHAARGSGTLEPTEYLKLLMQYLTQARELEVFAGSDNAIDVPECESAETAQLLKIIGYRLRGECGPAAVLETVNPSRAFLAIDSAFPLAELELAYRHGESFRTPFGPTTLPVLFDRAYWRGAARRSQEDFLDMFIEDPGLARLYVAMYNLHRPTAQALRAAVPVQRLKDYAPVIDFFGAMFEVRDGVAIVPGGDRARTVWEKLTGARVARGGEFFQALVEADDGWMAAYYDALARIQGARARAYFLNPTRIERFYAAVRGRVTSPGPARPIFRASADLLLLSSRVDFSSDGQPKIPGGIGPWRDLFVKHPHGKYDGKLTKSAAGWRDADDVIEAMFALSRKAIENQPLRMFLAISDLDRNRARPLSAATVARMIRSFPKHGEQFTLYNDSPDLSEDTIIAHLDAMADLDRIGNLPRRANSIGMLQAQLAIWQVLRRNGSIPESKADSSMRALLALSQATNDQQDVFELGRDGVLALLDASGGDPESPQQALLGLLVGQAGPAEVEAREEVLESISQLLALQRLAPLKTLFDLADHLERVSRGEAFNVAMANRLSANISDIRLPRSLLSVEESNAMAQGRIVERHIQRQRSLNLRRAVDRAQGNPSRLLAIRGGTGADLAGFAGGDRVRDSRAPRCRVDSGEPALRAQS